MEKLWRVYMVNIIYGRYTELRVEIVRIWTPNLAGTKSKSYYPTMASLARVMRAITTSPTEDVTQE